MQIGIIGINHKSGGVELREKLALTTFKIFTPFSIHGSLSFVLLSTCNRVEIYFSHEDLAEAHTYLLNILRGHLPFEFEHKIYSYFGVDCFYHLAKVTSGLDSAIIGETEIQGQVKQAYEHFSAGSSLNRELHYLFQKSLKIGKEMRRKLIEKMPLRTLEGTILRKSGGTLNGLKNKKILFVGISEINLKIAKKCHDLDLTFCNRTEEKGKKVAKSFGYSYLPWNLLHKSVCNFDLVIFATKAPHTILNREHIQAHKKMVIIDLSVPRNVDPALKQCEGITLFNIDELGVSHDEARGLPLFENEPILREVEKQIELYRKREMFYEQTLVS